MGRLKSSYFEMHREIDLWLDLIGFHLDKPKLEKRRVVTQRSKLFLISEFTLPTTLLVCLHTPVSDKLLTKLVEDFNNGSIMINR